MCLALYFSSISDLRVLPFLKKMFRLRPPRRVFIYPASDCLFVCLLPGKVKKLLTNFDAFLEECGAVYDKQQLIVFCW